MRNPLSETIVNIKPSGIRKYFDLVAQMNDPEVISLGVGEPDFETPWHIREEGIYSLEKGRTFYTSNSGLQALRDEISLQQHKLNNVIYNPYKEIMITVGGSEAIDIALRAMLDPGDEVIIPQPSYVSYEPCTVLAGGVPVIVEMKEKDQFKLTLEELEAAYTPKTKILILPFPNNPTGSVMTREDLEPIAKFCVDHDLYVLSDEIYSALTYETKHFSIVSLPGMRDRTVLINGFSKAYAMTGWRLGYACAPQVILQQMLKIHQFAIMCAPTTSQYAAVEALRNGDKDIEVMRESYNERRRYLMHEFRKMQLDCFEPYGAFYVFPSIKSLQMTSDEFAMELLREEKVAVVPGTAFGACGEGYLRISYAYSLEELKTALRRVERFVQNRRARLKGEEIV
jgi:aminotransferase